MSAGALAVPLLGYAGKILHRIENMKIIKTLLVLLLILTEGIALASKDPCPQVTQETIYGVWEAIYQKDTIRVFRLELLKEGVSVLSEGGYGGYSASWLERMEINNGIITLRFKDDLKPVTYIDNGIKYTTTGEVLIKGSGGVCRNGEGEHGAMDVQLIMEPNAPTPRVWELRFIKSGGKTYTEQIKSMAEAAEKGASVFRMRLQKK